MAVPVEFPPEKRNSDNTPAGGSGTFHPVANVGQLWLSRTTELSVSNYVSPTDLAGYQSISPEIAIRILEHNLKSNDQANRELEIENAHRRDLEKKDQQAATVDQKENRRLQSVGQRFALIVTVVAFAVVGWGFYMGHGAASATLGGAVIVGLAISFITGHFKKPDDAQSVPDATADSE